MSLKTIFTIIAASAISSPVFAQGAALRLPVPNEAVNIGGFSYMEGSVLGNTVSLNVVDLMSFSDRSNPRPDGRVNQIYVARTYVPDQRNIAPVVKWTDSEKCPSMFGVLTGFNALQAPRFDVPNLFGLPPVGAGIRTPKPVPLEAKVSSVWGRSAQADGAFSYMSIEAYNGLIVEFVDYARQQLSMCWSDQIPSIVR